MTKLKKIKYIAVVILIIAICIVINNIKIFTISSQSSEYVFDFLTNEYDSENTDVCILKYSYVTGAGWFVEKSTDKSLEKKYVCINSICNPRELKMNKDFELDYMAEFVVIIDKTDKYIEVDGEKVEMIYPKEVIVTGHYYQNDGFDGLRFGELTAIGKIKAIISVFVSQLRVHY